MPLVDRFRHFSSLRTNVQRCETFLAFNRVLIENFDEHASNDHDIFIGRFKQAAIFQFVVSLASIWDKESYDFSLLSLMNSTIAETKDDEVKRKLFDLKIHSQEIHSSQIVKRLRANRAEGFAHPLLRSGERKKLGEDFSLPSLGEYIGLFAETKAIVLSLHDLAGVDTAGEWDMEDFFYEEFKKAYLVLNADK